MDGFCHNGEPYRVVLASGKVHAYARTLVSANTIAAFHDGSRVERYQDGQWVPVEEEKR